MMLGAHLIKSWSSSQHCIAMSSGEAELYALVRGAAQTKGLMAMAGDMGFELQGKIYTDSTAAIGMSFRKGLGKTRHLDVQYLWIQDEVEKKTLEVKKVNTKENPADLFTKPLPATIIEDHTRRLYFSLDDTRAKSAPTLNSITRNSIGIFDLIDGLFTNPIEQR